MRTETEDPWARPEWFLLGYRKKMTASSATEGHGPELAADEDARTWWQAAAADDSEWLCMDLGEISDVRAVQINFADDVIDMPSPGEYHDGERYIDDAPMYTRWLLEGSEDGEHFYILEDKREAETDLSHDLVVMEEGRQLRYLRLSCVSVPYGQRPCVSGLRVFGTGNGKAPEEAEFTAERTGELDAEVRMRAEGAVGYNVLWGETPDKLYHSAMCFENTLRISALVRGRNHAIRVDTFNENGITEGKTVLKI